MKKCNNNCTKCIYDYCIEEDPVFVYSEPPKVGAVKALDWRDLLVPSEKHYWRLSTMAEQSNGETRCYTQLEVDEIVQKRLAREREQFEKSICKKHEELNVREKTLAEGERRLVAIARLHAEGLPIEAADFLHYETEKAYAESYIRMKQLLGPLLRQAIADTMGRKFR